MVEKSKILNNSGMTFIEMIAVVAILGIVLTSIAGLGNIILKKPMEDRFNNECETILIEFESLRKEAMMKQSAYHPFVLLYKDAIDIFTYDSNHRKYSTRRINLEESLLKGFATAKRIDFMSNGNISQSFTLVFQGHGGYSRKLVFQLATGRMYFSEDSIN